ncbi:MAG: FAD-dependent oxidoreductase [Clostridia bacterium]|nr:FAD-dependent oxidoreductase [Clostridia bacterium]
MSSDLIYNGSGLPSFPTLAGDAECDVLVIGGGVCGLLCAYYLQNAGVNVLVCEAERIAGAVTARSTAVVSVGQDVLCRDISLRHGAYAARTVMRSRIDALREYHTLCHELGCRFEVRDFYLYSTKGAARMEREYEQLRRFGVAATLLRDMPLNIKMSAAIHFSGQLQLDPLDFCARLVRGLTIRERTRITRLTRDGAETDKYRIYAKYVIIATHFPLPKLRGLYALKLYQKRSYVLALEGIRDIGGAYEDISEDGMYMRMYGKYLLLGGGDHRTGKSGGGFDAVLQYRADNFANLFAGSKIYASWATQDTVSLDGLPYIGRLTRSSDRCFVATGFGGYGFIGSMISATLLRDLILGRDVPAAKVYDPSRSMMSAQLFANVFTSLGNYLLPIPRRCPHLGCALKWNASECTWDCPCHGSRFDKCGALLNDPAQRDLR